MEVVKITLINLQPGHHERGGLVGPTTGLEVLRKIKSLLSLPGYENQIVQPVV
jgi:hypothetical protein